jgi:hypothetical protein
MPQTVLPKRDREYSLTQPCPEIEHDAGRAERKKRGRDDEKAEVIPVCYLKCTHQRKFEEKRR